MQGLRPYAVDGRYPMEGYFIGERPLGSERSALQERYPRERRHTRAVVEMAAINTELVPRDIVR